MIESNLETWLRQDELTYFNIRVGCISKVACKKFDWFIRVHHSCLWPYLMLVSMKRGTDAHLIHNSVYCRYGSDRGTHFIWWGQRVQRQVLGLYHGKYSCLTCRSGAAYQRTRNQIVICHLTYLSSTRNFVCFNKTHTKKAHCEQFGTV